MLEEKISCWKDEWSIAGFVGHRRKLRIAAQESLFEKAVLSGEESGVDGAKGRV